MELEHVGIAVRDAEAAVTLIDTLLGERPYKSEVVDSESVRTHFVRAGGAKLELLEALHRDSPIARHIEKRGPGLHHLAFEVDDLDAVHVRLIEAGFAVLGEPRRGADGKRIFFVHPRDTGGILFEFCRQERSAFTNFASSAAGRPPGVRHTETRGPAVLIESEISLDLETVARRLEQSAHVIIAPDVSAVAHELRDDEKFHVIMSARRVSMIDSLGTGVRTLTIVVDEPTDAALADRPTLIAALPPAASAAAALYARWSAADLAIGSVDLLALAIERHLRRNAEP